MKTLKLLFLLCLVLLVGCSLFYPSVPNGNTAPGEGAVTGDYPPSELNLLQISMQDIANGWGLAENGLFRTEDGGYSWSSVTPAGLSELGASAVGYFSDSSTAWLLIPDLNDPARGTLYRTTDAGSSWLSAQVPFSSGYFDFIDPLTGWNLFISGAAAGSSAAQLYHTVDGGETWSLVSETNPDQPLGPGNLPFSGSKSGIGFFDEQHGWLTGSVPMPGSAYLYRTDDGGKSWQPQQLALLPEAQQAMLEVYPPQIFSNKHGKLPIRIDGPTPQILVYSTLNAGQDWKSTSAIESSGTVDFTSMQLGFAWDGGKIFGTLDGGMTWLVITSSDDFSQSLLQYQFVDSIRGWALAQEGSGDRLLYYTEDTGNHWSKLP